MRYYETRVTQAGVVCSQVAGARGLRRGSHRDAVSGAVVQGALAAAPEGPVDARDGAAPAAGGRVLWRVQARLAGRADARPRQVRGRLSREVDEPPRPHSQPLPYAHSATFLDLFPKIYFQRYISSLVFLVSKIYFHVSGEWTEDEDELLDSAVEEHGIGKWVAVAADVPNRSDAHCMRRWQSRNKAQHERFRQNRAIVKDVLPRKRITGPSAKPTLTADDFTMELKLV